MGQQGFAKRRGATWTGYWKVDSPRGRLQRTKGGFRTKSEAVSFLTTTLAGLQSGIVTDPNRLTVGEYLLDRWLPTIRPSVRPSTYDSYRRNIELHIVPELGPVRLQGA